MYLLERLFGVFTYVTVLAIICSIIILAKPKYIGKILFVYTGILSVMGFLFIPNKGNDLFRLIPMMYNYAELTLGQIVDFSLGSTTPTAILYMYFIGKFNLDGLLAGATTFIFFMNVFYIVKKSTIKYKLSSKDVALIVFLLMSTGIFFEVISGIRSMLAFSIISVCFYKEVEEEKPFIKNIGWYLFAGLLHNVGLALILIRAGYILIQKKDKKNPYKVGIIIVLLLSGIVVGQKYIAEMLDLAYTYLVEGTYSYIWEYIIGFIYWIILTTTLIYAYKGLKLGESDLRIHNSFKVTLLVQVILTVFVMEYNIFHRFTLLNSILIVPTMSYVLSRFKLVKNIRLFFLGLGVLILGIACARGNLSSLKFFIL